MNIDKYLVKELKSNNEVRIQKAFNQVYNHYYKLVYFCIATYLDNKEDCEEVMNDTFVKVFNQIKNLDENKNLKYYLTTTARNLAISFWRTKKSDIVEYQEGMLPIIPQAPNEIIEQLKAILEEEEINLIIQHLIYGYSFKEIAHALEISINTVMSKYRRALKKAQKVMR